MNLNITYLIIFLFTSIIVPVNNTIAPSSNKFNSSELILTDEYFPILTNKILIYDSDFGDAELKISKNKNLNVFSLESEDFIYRQKLLIDQNGVFVKETYQKINVLFGLTKEGTLTYNEPLPRIKFPFEAGKKWNWKGKEFDDDDTYILDLNSRIDNIEKVTVPAGTFDAIKLVTSVKSTKGTKSNVTEWYAKDVGLIKMIAIVEGGGVIGAARDLLGLGEIVFELKEVKSK
jgi:hypothetical protein